ncbi:MAG: hypothetical protein ACO2PN_27830 [Pyrobaculum sp.]|jgi:hypothetical protein
MKMKMICVYDGEEWVDTLRIYEVPTGGYVLMHIEDEDLHFFYTVGDVLKAATQRVAFENTPHIGPCP